MSFEFSPVALARYPVIDQTYPSMTDNLAIMIPYPEKENKFSLKMLSTSTITVTKINKKQIHFFYFRKKCKGEVFWLAIFLFSR